MKIFENQKIWSLFSILKKYFLLGLVVWITHFLQVDKFGLYYDDHNHLVPALNYRLPILGEHIYNLIIDFPEGRPLHEILISVFTYLGKNGGITSVYLWAYLLIFINVILFYKLLKIIYPNELFCLTGALSYCLYPADPSRIWLTHTFGIESSMTFFLLASLSYLSGKKLLSYIIITAALLTYETSFLIFIPLVLLEKESSYQKLSINFLKHNLILLIIFSTSFLIRVFLGDPRTSNLDFSSALNTLNHNLTIGSIMSFSMYLYRPLEAIQSLDSSGYWILAYSLVLSILIFFSINLNQIISLPDNTKFNPYLKLIIVGILLLLCAYLLAIRETIIFGKVLNGKLARIHFSAIVGNSIIWSASFSLILMLAKNIYQKRLVLLSISFYFALLIYFGNLVQADFAQSWSLQRAIFTDIVRLCPDLNLDTVILVDANFDIPKYADPIEEVTKDILKRIYKFPNQHPKAYVLRSDWKNKVEILDNQFIILNNSTIGIASEDEQRQIKLSNVIYLQAKEGNLARINNRLNILEHQVNFKPISPTFNHWEKSKHFEMYINQEWLKKPVKYI